MGRLTIAGLAREGGVGVETVRYYQRRGLLEVPQKGLDGAVRRYGADDLRRLRFIRSAQAAGFTLEQIADLMRMDTMSDREPARSLALARIEALDAKIEELTKARNALVVLARRCSAGSTGPCPILSAFERDPDTELRQADV
jgi:MerR family mercuric resistance operon transcriptional regulator